MNRRLTNGLRMVGILLALTAILTSGCAPKTDPIIGRWEGPKGVRVQFKENGTGEFTVMGLPVPPATIKWTKSGDGKLVIEIQATPGHPADKRETTATVVGDTLSIAGKEDEMVTYTRAK